MASPRPIDPRKTAVVALGTVAELGESPDFEYFDYPTPYVEQLTVLVRYVAGAFAVTSRCVLTFKIVVEGGTDYFVTLEDGGTVATVGNFLRTDVGAAMKRGPASASGTFDFAYTIAVGAAKTIRIGVAEEREELSTAGSATISVITKLR